jgi:hypothetical protein
MRSIIKGHAGASTEDRNGRDSFTFDLEPNFGRAELQAGF